MDPTTRDAYQEWRARLAAKHDARRGRSELPSTPAPAPRWDPALLFESARPAESPEDDVVATLTGADAAPAAIDLRTPLDATGPCPAASDPAPPPQLAAVPSRPRALVSSPAGSSEPGPARPSPAVADALRELNERRVAGAISEAQFNARKAELFA
jgi:hypothetical protein